MKIVKYSNKNNNISYGALVEDKEYRVREIANNPYLDDSLQLSDIEFELKPHQLLTPCLPSKIICFAINFEGITGFNGGMNEPLVFLKSNNSLCLNNSIVTLPFENNSWGEAEIGVVIKKKAKNIRIENFAEHILGYVIANDISTANIDNRDHHLARSKSADGYCPISNYIDTKYDPISKSIESYHNDILLRKGNSNQMFWDIPKLITWLSTWMTLYPEDLILTGSPSRVRERIYLKKGDTFTCKVEGFKDLVTKFK